RLHLVRRALSLPLRCLSLFVLLLRRPPSSPLFPYTTLSRSVRSRRHDRVPPRVPRLCGALAGGAARGVHAPRRRRRLGSLLQHRSEEHTSELQSLTISYAVFCLKKKTQHECARHTRTHITAP